MHGVVPAIVNGDRRRIGQAIRNLVDNAVRHTRTKVWIETDVAADSVDIVVADDGPGIPPDSRQDVFDRFVRLDDARSRDGGGTGLGIAVVKTIVNAHDGRIDVIDHPIYPGAVIRIRLPRAPRGEPAEPAGS